MRGIKRGETIQRRKEIKDGKLFKEIRYLHAFSLNGTFLKLQSKIALWLQIKRKENMKYLVCHNTIYWAFTNAPTLTMICFDQFGPKFISTVKIL